MKGLLQITLFPVLGLLGIVTLLLGIIHVFLCLPFFFLGFGILDGLFVLVLTFHGCLLHYPNRGHCVMQAVAACMALVLAILSILELLCTDDEESLPLDGSKESVRSSVCFGVQIRTAFFTTRCSAHMDRLTQSIYGLFGDLGAANTRKAITGGLAGVALLQLLCTSAAFLYCSIQARMRPKGYHCQIVLAVFIAILGCLHTVFCCMYFYVGFCIWGGALILIQAILTMESKGIGMLARSVNLVGAGLGMSIAAINVFGLFCWFEGLSKESDWAFRYHCQWRSETYGLCERRLQHGDPYAAWDLGVARSEIRNFQFISYAGLIISGLIQLLISLHSMFRKLRS